MQHADVQHRPKTAQNVTVLCKVSAIVTLLVIVNWIFAKTQNTSYFISYFFIRSVFLFIL